MKYLYWDLILNNPKRIEIYLSGCKEPHCKNCHNPESWNFNNGHEVDNDLIYMINEYCDFYEDVWILGGDPIDQNISELIWLLDSFKNMDKKIWLWTKYELNEINEEILKYCDYVKTGKFISSVSSYVTEYGFELASSNQKIIKLK